MHISLVMATYGRYNEIKVFLESLLKQTHKDFDLIIVDQNDQIQLKPLIDKFKKDIKIRHIRSEKGLSKARNVGLTYITGDITAFPDDDCIYRPDTLYKVNKHFQNNKDCNGIIGNSVSKFSNQYQMIPRLKKLNKYSVWFHGISYTIFIENKVINDVGNFDENLGVGSGTKFGSGEETDYLIRGIEKNYNLFYDETLEIFHPEIDFKNNMIHKKAYNYSVGRMYVIKKHNYNFIFKVLNQVYPLFKMISSLHQPNKLKYLWYQFLGRVANV